MSKHTPGPWKASDRWGNFGDRNRHESDAPTGQVSRFSYSVADEDGFVVAHCAGPLVTMDSERSEANARLIAAAPELLAACKRARGFVRGDHESNGIVGVDGMLAVLNAAIALAENGGKP